MKQLTASKKRAQDGFSMVEAMIGVVLIVVAMQSVIPLATSSTQLSSLVSENHLVRAQARQKMDQIRQAEFASVPDLYHGHAFNIDVDDDGNLDLTPVPGQSAVGLVQVQQVPGGLLVGEALHVSVRVRWQSSKGHHEFVLQTTIARD